VNRLLDQLLHRALPLALVLGMLLLLRLTGVGVGGAGAQSTTIAIGFLLTCAYIGGTLAARVKLPRITGFLVVGIAVGPHVSGLLTEDMLLAGKMVEEVAVALIALTAGGELRLDWVRRELRRLLLITFSELTVVATGVITLVLLTQSLFPFIPRDDFHRAIVIAMVVGTIAVSNSPMVAVALIAENEADGPLTRTVLGVTIVKDVSVIILFGIAIAVAKKALGEADAAPLGWTLARELGGSVSMGIAFGLGISAFLRYVARDTPVFLLAACLAMARLSSMLHLETLLVALTAGVWVENFSATKGAALIKAIERVSLPVYALFFAAAGAKVNLGVLASLWPLALMLCSVRAACVWFGTWIGTRLASAEPVVKRYAWYGFISQAGVTLALSAIVARSFPDWGPAVQALIIAMIAVHELLGPIGFQYALRRAGEIGAQRRARARAGDSAAPESGALSSS
jgi:Kef-type K+ transport system membrane component KefB